MNSGRIDELRDPGVFPERRALVEIVQTHLSVVCLVGDFAYKFKKAIRLPFADFSTLERRKHFCEEELRLNRRLCPEIYLEVLALCQVGDGALRLGSEDAGPIVDYALRMRRMPADRMLDVLLEQDHVSVAEIEAIAGRMVRFHAEADRGAEVRDFGAPEKLKDFALANFEETRGQAGTRAIFPADLHAGLERRTRIDFEEHLPLLRKRAASGRVVDGHGDLHARNICLTDPVAIYDCIEFNPAFRCGDTATEHAFLAMDLRFRGHAELAKAYLEAVVTANGDEEMRRILPMLVRYRAMVRAKVSAIAAGEGELSEEERSAAAETARRYLRLAAVSAIEERGPLWLMFCGMPASGKSSVAEALHFASGDAWPVFSSDRIRKELAGVPATEELPNRFYSADFSARTYAELRARATSATAGCGVVVLDANFRGRAERTFAREAAKSVGARLVLLRIEADEAVVMARLARRADDPDAESDADRSVYERLESAFEMPTAEEADLLLPVSGDLPPTEAVDAILADLLG